MKVSYGVTAGTQCSKCARPAKARGLCISHYSLWRRSTLEPRPCLDCGKLHTQTANLCTTCYGRAYRSAKSATVSTDDDTITRSAFADKWPDELETWTTLAKCSSKTALRSYLSERSSGEVWPNTDHSLACWISAQRYSNHFCFCQSKEAR